MKTKNTSKGLLLLICSGLFILSCNKGSSGGYGSNNNGGNPASSGNTISIYNMLFGSGSLTVKSGTTVTWTNNDNVIHTVTADDGSFTSADLKLGDTYSHTFNTVGSYPYHCIHHAGMKATIVVN